VSTNERLPRVICATWQSDSSCTRAVQYGGQPGLRKQCARPYMKAMHTTMYTRHCVYIRRDHVAVRSKLVVGGYIHLCLEHFDKVAEENADVQPRGA
jgi:hypothetical protein